MTFKGLGKIELRSEMATTEMTGAEFEYLKQHPTECPEEMKKVFTNMLQWEKRHHAAMKAVKTKRNKYATWPGGRRK